MQKCALCEFDYENVSLQEGRCPQCGSIVEWPEEPESPPISARDLTLPPSDIPSDLPVKEQANPVAFNPSEGDPNSSAPSTDDSPSVIPNRMDQLWRASIQGNSNPRSTIKGPSVGHTVSDSVFAILPREVRSPC